MTPTTARSQCGLQHWLDMQVAATGCLQLIHRAGPEPCYRRPRPLSPDLERSRVLLLSPWPFDLVGAGLQSETDADRVRLLRASPRKSSEISVATGKKSRAGRNPSCSRGTGIPQLANKYDAGTPDILASPMIALTLARVVAGPMSTW